MDLDVATVALAVLAYAEMRYQVGGIARRVACLEVKPSGVSLPMLMPCLALVALGSLMVGCGDAGARSPAPGAVPPVLAGPASILARVALAAAALAGVGWLACLVAAIFVPLGRLAWIKRAAACLGLAAASQALYWFAHHVAAFAWLGVAGAGLCGCAYLWVRRRELETLTGVDLDRDGTVGPLALQER